MLVTSRAGVTGTRSLRRVWDGSGSDAGSSVGRWDLLRGATWGQHGPVWPQLSWPTTPGRAAPSPDPGGLFRLQPHLLVPLCRYHLKDVIVGKIYFLLVRIKIKHMEIDIIKRETTGTGPNVYHENDTIAKYEIMDGAPVRGEPARLGASGPLSRSVAMSLCCLHLHRPCCWGSEMVLPASSCTRLTSQALDCLAKWTLPAAVHGAGVTSRMSGA